MQRSEVKVGISFCFVVCDNLTFLSLKLERATLIQSRLGACCLSSSTHHKAITRDNFTFTVTWAPEGGRHINFPLTTAMFTLRVFVGLGSWWTLTLLYFCRHVIFLSYLINCSKETASTPLTSHTLPFLPLPKDFLLCTQRINIVTWRRLNAHYLQSALCGCMTLKSSAPLLINKYICE